MRTAVFIMLPAVSHYLAAFGLASQLEREGYRIVFTGTGEHKPLIINEGFGFCTLGYADEYRIRSLKVFFGLLLKTIVDRSFTISRIRTFSNHVNDAARIMHQYAPDKIFLDEHLCHYYFLLNKWSDRIIILNTKLSTRRRLNIPPLTSGFIPSDTWHSRLYVSWLWLQHLLKIQWREFLLHAAFLGKDDQFFLERYCQKNRISWRSKIDRSHSFYRTICNHPTLILCPQQLEFPGYHSFSNEKYQGTSLYRNDSTYFTPEIHALIDAFTTARSDKKIVYCSFGTIPTGRVRFVNQFLNRLVSVIIKRGDVFLIISKPAVEFNIPSHPHIKVFPFLPQFALLRHVDVMISHGGMGSIKECLHWKVPMYILPQDLKTDQPGNAARVIHRKIGVRGNLKTEKTSQIAVKLDHLFSMRDQMKENMCMLLK